MWTNVWTGAGYSTCGLTHNLDGLWTDRDDSSFSAHRSLEDSLFKSSVVFGGVAHKSSQMPNQVSRNRHDNHLRMHLNTLTPESRTAFGQLFRIFK